MTTFEELVEVRGALKAFTQGHAQSVLEFYDAKEQRFNVDAAGSDSKSSKTVRHLTSTLTCLESLRELFTDAINSKLTAEERSRLGESMPIDEDATFSDALQEMVADFAHQALDNPKDWNSDGAAFVYCRVRTLGSLLRMLDDMERLETIDLAQVRSLLDYAWAS